MKNTIITTVFFLTTLLSFPLFSQNPLNTGETQINAGVGLSSWGIPIYFGADYAYNNDITIGGEITLRSFREHYLLKDYRHNVIGFAGNANYHFNNLLEIDDDWDTYAGINVGFYYWNSPSDYFGSRTSGLGLGLQIGGRYYFSDKMGINLEFGGGNAFAGGKFGISLKL